MSELNQPEKALFISKGLMEFTFRFATIMLDRALMTADEAVALLDGVATALDTGRQNTGAIKAFEGALGRARSSRIG